MSETVRREKPKFKGLTRELIALRASQEIEDGYYVNLGIGIPTLISDWVYGRDVILHSEIGMLGTGPLAFGEEVDSDLINASCQPIKLLPGAACFDVIESFNMIRGGYIDVAIMGAFQVNASGDYAGWANPSRGLDVGNIGGSMDLCAGAKKLIITMEHMTKDGQPKVVSKLNYPATTKGKVNKIITDLAVMDITKDGLLLREVYPGLTPADIQSVTEPRLAIDPDLKEMAL